MMRVVSFLGPEFGKMVFEFVYDHFKDSTIGGATEDNLQAVGLEKGQHVL
jgi:hypothetical protein